MTNNNNLLENGNDMSECKSCKKVEQQYQEKIKEWNEYHQCNMFCNQFSYLDAIGKNCEPKVIRSYCPTHPDPFRDYSIPNKSNINILQD